MNTAPSPLPADWVDGIFAKLQVRFGREFLLQYAGLDLAAVKADWADQLAGLQRRRNAIEFAIENLPQKAPNVGVFREICRRAPDIAEPRLPSPPVNKAMARAALAASARIMRAPKDPLDWARRLQARDEAGENLTYDQRVTYRKALRLDVHHV